jgi:hypothetical protein
VVINLFSRETRRIIRKVIKLEVMILLFENKLEGLLVLEKCAGEMVNEIYNLCRETCSVALLEKNTKFSLSFTQNSSCTGPIKAKRNFRNILSSCTVTIVIEISSLV